MKSHTEYLTFNVPGRVGFVNITPQCEEAVRKSGVREGLLLCNAMHITGSETSEYWFTSRRATWRTNGDYPYTSQESATLANSTCSARGNIKGMPQPPLNYETPKRGTSGAAAFWATFIASAIAGLVFATVIDNLIYHARTGRYPDGGASIISVLGIPLAALVAALVRALRKPKQTTWWVAACCGIAAAPVTVALLYAIW